MNSVCAHVHITGQDRATYEMIYQPVQFNIYMYAFSRSFYSNIYMYTLSIDAFIHLHVYTEHRCFKGDL